MQVTIRPAQDSDIPFLGWVMFTSARSHLAACPWSVIFRESETRTRILLELMSQAPALQWSHVSKFWIAEADGTPAAAMCGFAPAAEGLPAPADSELRIAERAFGYSGERLVEVSERITIAASGMPDDLPDVWAIENVAALPEYRGKGLADRLFEHVLDVGRGEGFRRAQILCLIGNEPGQRAFERNGFRVLTQKTNPEFEALFGTPGARLLAQDL
ncbi:hypothetical protein MNBD_GAMMA15-2230 [hydrothermal vent metagenome]|uniref:N-acetyltransferase domain-containing protein n=1 Tax=hydrothermal vent metagenome TaxID=652676 RepID=A0A3B0YDC2_9ZZZZ